jgi:hypothetical protein
VISITIHLTLPAKLLLTSANMSNLGAMIFPFILIYLNSKLPRPARPHPIAYVILVLFAIFYGFFFVNFVTNTFFGEPLVVF